MSADFLLELRCEEIPARMQAKASEDLARLFTEKLAEAGIKAEKLTSYVTPRRLALIAHGLPLATEAVSEEFKGPRTSAPDQALDGFLRKTGLSKDQLEDRDGVWFAVVEKPGRATAQVLADAIPAIVRAFPWPKSMRWGDASLSTESLRWVRPLQGIVALLGEDVVPFAIEGIDADRITAGHRFHFEGRIAVQSAASYADQLRAAHVIVDQEERKRLIEERANALAAEAGLELIPDAGLVAENGGLTEWPVPLLGRFDPAFLEVPPEVIQLTLRINQKYFVLRDKAGALANAFICTANIDAIDGGKAIVEGNGKVLAARLSDARFFWEQDKKTALADHAKKLARITFHEKLGTVADKVERVAKLAEWLASEGIVPNCNPTLARQAAELCKADLVTEMVGEFPELQGLMGGYYARAEGLPDAVADAIRDHYKPVGQADKVPTAPVSVAVGLADKLDTLVSLFSANEEPTGSRDPFALRRAALGILNTVLTNNIRMPLVRTTKATGAKYRLEDLPDVPDDWRFDALRNLGTSESADQIAPMLNQLLGERVVLFLGMRFFGQLKAAGARHDLVEAVFGAGTDDFVGMTLRADALRVFIDSEDGASLLAGYKRAANILKKERPETVKLESDAGEEDTGAALTDPSVAEAIRAHEALPLSYTPEPAEAALIAALDQAEPRAAAAVEAEDFEGAMAALATLRAPIDAFFDGVTVNDSDEVKRESRLNLLTRIRAAMHKVADFSEIQG
jgi:glycyl-tRNA synthetase beta chain